MTSYGQVCPVAQALQIVGERWTLLIIRELLCGNYRFNQLLNGVPLMSRSLLAQRLRTLEEAGLVERRELGAGRTGVEYRLTPPARELEPIVMGLGVWGQRWARQNVRTADLDPVLLMWDLHRGLHLDRLPQQQTTVSFWLRDVEAKRSRYWLRVKRPAVELCLTNPGFEEDLRVQTTVRTLVDVWMGEKPLAQALRSKAIEVEGAPKLVREFPKWLKLNTFSRVPRPPAEKRRPSTAAGT
jgi:DNA-binding HxlR family transcriptional regulator